MGRGEEQVRRIEEDEARELKAEQQDELDRGEQEEIEESQGKVQGNTPLTAHGSPCTCRDST
jgi:hypothetical protein